jgi:phytoene synthase
MTGSYRRLVERVAGDPALALGGRASLPKWEKRLVLAQSLIGAAA